MDIHTRDAYGTKQPRGLSTTLLDLVSRDDQDATFFPTNANITRFTRDEGHRTIPFTSVFREFTFRGPTDFNQTFLFDIGDVNCGDLIQGLFIQVQLGHWLTGLCREYLKMGKYVYDDTTPQWNYVNSLGTILLNEATLEMDDQILERITGDSCNVISRLFPDLNTQIGIASVEGIKSIEDMRSLGPTDIFPSENGWITIPLCFSMLRAKVTNTFPLISCRKGTIRVRISLKPFHQVVRIITGQRATENDSPLGKNFIFDDLSVVPPRQSAYSVYTSLQPPGLVNIQLLTYGILVDGQYREMLLRQPYEKPYREIQQFDFTEPLKYVINKSSNDIITIQLPLEANQPVEEIVWFLRRKAAITENNDWINYSATLEKDYDPVYNPLVPLLVRAKIQANGQDIISNDEAWFRSHISRAHKSGKISYDSFIYGYSFSKHPGEHNPSGSINASRLNSLRLTLDVMGSEGSDSEWEVHVFVFAFQWLRFENGLCSKVFMD